MFKKISTILSILFFILNIQAQQIERQVIATAGGYDSTANLSVSWTIGEPFTQTLTGDSITITQGFQQPSIIISEISKELLQSIQVSAYPNPTSDKLNIIIDGAAERYIITLCDINGKKLNVIQTESTLNPISLDMTPYADGSYILTITQQSSGKVNNYKIVKVAQ